MAQRLFPNCYEHQLKDIAWCCTPFPAGTQKDFIDGLVEMSILSGGDGEKAMNLAHEKMDKALGLNEFEKDEVE
ncbi:MAG: hypothetical protein AAGG02_10815 [Cyanobacteria bacterium P01_H01_bin.15]